MKFATILTVVMALSVSGVYAKEDEHKHETKVFASVAAGMAALDAAIVDAKSKVAAGKFEALHSTSEDIHSIAGGLKPRVADVAVDAKDRFKFNVDQLQNLHEQLEDAHHAANKADAERVIKRLEDVSTRLKALAP